MKKVGIVGWRGMVGSVLMERMSLEKDFENFSSVLFSTSQKGQKAPSYPNCHSEIMDSDSIDQLREMDIIVTCQGGDYTKSIHPKLREIGWNGHWIDAASALRMDEKATIVLDPINKGHIENYLNDGGKDLVGGNCTVSLMLMGIGGLFKEGLVEWMTSQTYQAASGGGAKTMIELLDQLNHFSQKYTSHKTEHPTTSALEYEKLMTNAFFDNDFPKNNFGAPLGLSLLPWIDTKVESGQSREEWKAQVEANKILGNSEIIPIDGTCVRVASLRCHSQAFTIKLKKSVDIKTVEDIITQTSEWTELIPNDKEVTLEKLTPAYTTGTLKVPVGRVRNLTLGDQYINAFSIGDQLLWGAAEPLRRVLRMITG